MTEQKPEIERNALVAQRRKEQETYQRSLDMEWLDNRMEDGRMGRCLGLIKQEADMEKDFQERTDHAAIVNEKAAKEIALGKEIAKIRDEEANLLLRRHYLRQQDPMLRALTAKLQASYVCRDQRQQILHNEYKQLQNKIEEQRSNDVLAKSLCNDQDLLVQEELASKVKKQQYRSSLKQQLDIKNEEKNSDIEKVLMEKKVMDNIIKNIQDEDVML